ncbi:hypothetical protein, partial [Bartonella melophagi]
MVTVNNMKMTGVVGGISMKGSGTLKVNNGTIELASGGDVWGVYVGDGVTSASLTGTTITGGERWRSGGGESVGVETESSGTVTLDGVTVSKVGMGVKVTSGSLEIKGGTKIMVRPDGTGIKVGSGVTRAELNDVRIGGSGTGTGVDAVGTGTKEMTVALEKVTIGGFKTGVEMVGTGGTLTIEKGTTISFMGNEGVGVIVGGGVTSASLTGTTITGDGSGMGVYAMGVGEMTVALDNVRISKVAKGVSVEGTGTLTMNKGTTVEFKGGDGYGVYV